MKKKFTSFILAFTFFVALTVPFSISANEAPEIAMNIEMEYLDDDQTPCRWRVCRTNTSTGERDCGEWTYGYCLDEVIVEA